MYGRISAERTHSATPVQGGGKSDRTPATAVPHLAETEQLTKLAQLLRLGRGELESRMACASWRSSLREITGNSNASAQAKQTSDRKREQRASGPAATRRFPRSHRQKPATAIKNHNALSAASIPAMRTLSSAGAVGNLTVLPTSPGSRPPSSPAPLEAKRSVANLGYRFASHDASRGERPRQPEFPFWPPTWVWSKVEGEVSLSGRPHTPALTAATSYRDREAKGGEKQPGRGGRRRGIQRQRLHAAISPRCAREWRCRRQTAPMPPAVPPNG